MSSSINGMRSPMMKGPRREAKTVCTELVISTVAKLENVDRVPDSIRDQLLTQLRAMLHVAQRMNWIDLERRIKRAVEPRPPHDPVLDHVWSP